MTLSHDVDAGADADANADAVTVSLRDLQDGTLPFDILQKAFGPDSFGILLVKDLPPHFLPLRHRALSYASYLSSLAPEVLERLEKPAAKYLVGWSLGKDMLKDGKPDTLKGSFYANCAFYVDPTLDCAQQPANGGHYYSLDRFPEYLTPNIWPSETALPGFKETLEALCRAIIDIAVLVARACDRFAEQEIEGYPRGYVEHVVRTSTTTKARLLHYLPRAASANDDDDDDWCATHLDHGCLTGLTSAMFIDEAAVPPVPVLSSMADHGADNTGVPLLLPPLEELSASPNPDAGLHIRSRNGTAVRVRIPRDCLAFQTGETLERITRGRFRAVPHFVKGVRPGADAQGHGRAIARNTLAVFTQPNLDEEVDRERHITFGDFAAEVLVKNTLIPGKA